MPPLQVLTRTDALRPCLCDSVRVLAEHAGIDAYPDVWRILAGGRVSTTHIDELARIVVDLRRVADLIPSSVAPGVSQRINQAALVVATHLRTLTPPPEA